MNFFSPDRLLLIIFVLNILLVLLDATVGYHLAPGLLRMTANRDDEAQKDTLRKIRNLLSGLVALYMFVNCLGYFGRNFVLMMIVAGMIALDLAVQLFMYKRSGNDGDKP